MSHAQSMATIASASAIVGARKSTASKLHTACHDRPVSDLAALTLAAVVTILATGLGAIPVAALGPARTARVHAGLSGFAAGAMAVAAIRGLIVPGLDDGGPLAVFGGALVGAALLVLLRRRLGRDRAD